MSDDDVNGVRFRVKVAKRCEGNVVIVVVEVREGGVCQIPELANTRHFMRQGIQQNSVKIHIPNCIIIDPTYRYDCSIIKILKTKERKEQTYKAFHYSEIALRSH